MGMKQIIPMKGAQTMENERRFIVKCDDCKVTIKTEATQYESIAGGRCDECKGR